MQRGVVRTNCIDCLDRTNVAQFCIGRCLLQRQLLALGFVSASSALGLEPANALLMRMYEEMGTQLALQYGGSQAVGTPNSNAASDFLRSVKRFYRNTFTDLEKQHIMDVFLGVFTPSAGGPHIWDLDSDLHLHNRPPPHFQQTFYPPPLLRTRSPQPHAAEEAGLVAMTKEAAADATEDLSPEEEEKRREELLRKQYEDGGHRKRVQNEQVLDEEEKDTVTKKSVCRNCGEPGHLERDCQKVKRGQRSSGAMMYTTMTR